MAGKSRGSKPDKILRDALILELNRMGEDDDGKKVKKVNRIVHKLVLAGMDGKIDAIKEIFDRVEGRPAQAIVGDLDNPISVIHRIERVIVAHAKN
jgi:hypothetical protein